MRESEEMLAWLVVISCTVAATSLSRIETQGSGFLFEFKPPPNPTQLISQGILQE